MALRRGGVSEWGRTDGMGWVEWGEVYLGFIEEFDGDANCACHGLWRSSAGKKDLFDENDLKEAARGKYSLGILDCRAMDCV